MKVESGSWIAAVWVAVAMAWCVTGCRAGYAQAEPVPSNPVFVQPQILPTASAAGSTPVPISATTKSMATSVGDVEVRTAVVQSGMGTRTKAVLIVQNHTGLAETPFNLLTLGDWLQTALGAGSFAVINPHDNIGTEQNVGPWGENMPESSAVRLAENLDAPVLLTASVTSARVREIVGTDPGLQAVLEFTLSAKSVPGGDGLAAVTAAARSKKESSPFAFERRAVNTWSELAKEAAFSAARAMETEYAKAHVTLPARESVRVAFSANVAGANLRIDGVSYGTLGPEMRAFSVSKGLHNLEVTYPWFVAFKDLVKIQEETTFAIRLALTPKGNAFRKNNALFDATMDRLEKSGATDDLVREVIARGYGQYLSASHTRIEGMPQSFTLQNSELPSLGLPDNQVTVPAGPSTEELIDRAGQLAQ